LRKQLHTVLQGFIKKERGGREGKGKEEEWKPLLPYNFSHSQFFFRNIPEQHRIA